MISSNIIKIVCTSLALLSPVALSVTVEKVDVFTVDGLTYEIEQARLSQQLKVPVSVRQIDKLYKLEMSLSAGLPNDEESAMKMADERLQKLNQGEILSMYEETADAIIMAKRLGVTKVPAVVFNERWIVYGLDPLQAHAQFERIVQTGKLN